MMHPVYHAQTFAQQGRERRLLHILAGTSKGTERRPSVFRPAENEFIWILGVQVSEEELQNLKETFLLHDIDIARVRRQTAKGPRLAIHARHISFALSFVEGSATAPTSVKMDFIVSGQFLIMLAESMPAHIEELFERALRKDFLSHGFELTLYYTLLGFTQAAQKLADQIQDRGERVLDGLDRNENLFVHIRTERKSANTLLKLVDPQGRIYSLLGSHEFPYTTEISEAYFSDLAEQAQEIVDELDALRDNLLDAVQGYTSIQSNNMNKVMKVLTLVSTIFLPATLVASIYGMNFRIPEYAWPHGYAYSLSLMIGIAFLSLLLMKRKGWF